VLPESNFRGELIGCLVQEKKEVGLKAALHKESDGSGFDIEFLNYNSLDIEG